MNNKILDVINRIKTGTPLTVTNKYRLALWLSELSDKKVSVNIVEYTEKIRLILVKYKDDILSEKNKAEAISKALNDLKILFVEAQNDDEK
ncbi:MAG: hypothetical protein E2O29_01880 [Deltaproteobacteria bacterium]|nr:MAG: hypothetical protein E2O29_01880 [Deltaproteobacteria bacterium]